ncbi:MAG: ATP-dependent Clp protease adapter ClpS [Candidatus Aminicenantes bacterium]|nr:ATP-dependent Clp protease adapter ClpS [Candidatus Aminicenantes bacterium]
MAEGLDIDDVIDVEGGVSLATEKKVKKPKMYKVLIYNDDYTSMEFVVEVLISIFNKPRAEATRIMLDVHKKGKGICGVYTYDIAVTKVNRVYKFARLYEYPLKSDIEEE